MQKRRALFQRLLRGQERLQHLVLHAHEREDLVQRPAPFRRGQHDGVAHIAGHVPLGDHHVPVGHQVAGLIEGHVFRRQDARALRMGERPGQIDLQNPRARVLRAQRLGVKHVRQRHVVRKKPFAHDLRRRVHAGDVLAQVPEPLRRFHRAVLAEEVRRHQDGVLDLLVASAAADVAADGGLHVRAAGGKGFIEELLGGDHHAGDAEAALHRARRRERVGVDRLFAETQALDGENVRSFQLGYVGDAGPLLRPVHQHHAGAARAHAAGGLDGGQAQLVPQEVDQLPALRLRLPPVDPKRSQFTSLQWFTAWACFGRGTRRGGRRPRRP